MNHLPFRSMPVFAAVILLTSLSVRAEVATPPTSFDDRLTVELVAQEPEIVTPTGIAVDEHGRIWCIENNTHFTPKNYKGFATDRIQIFEDFEPNGHARKISTFADGFKNSMALVLGKDGAVFFAMRNEILLLRDTKNAGVADERKTLIKLETEGNYPHNGLSGLALGPDKKLYFGLGENLGKPYSIIGSDGITLKGGGEGGNIYRCNKDGSKLEVIATGFWNPWGLGFDAFGRLFAVDNDPDSRPPCRLLHVVEGGDYGFRFRYGRKGTHPFVAWNGEIPGTLPMVSGTGEAPCTVYACESKGMPNDLRGSLLVTCWADNVIQRFKLTAEGASFKSRPEELIKGGANFRPVGLVAAPDGSIIVSDWANASYPVHGHGRIWRIRMKTPETEKAAPVGDAELRTRYAYLQHFNIDLEKKAAILMATENDQAPEVLMLRMKILAEIEGKYSEHDMVDFVKNDACAEVQVEALGHIVEKDSANKIIARLSSKDPFLFSAVVNALGRLGDIDLLTKKADDKDAHIRLGVLLALHKSGNAAAKSTLAKFLLDPDLDVRRAAVQWVGEERLTEFNATISDVIKLPMTSDLFKAILATQSLLAGDKPDKGEYIESQMAQIFPSDKHPAHFRALALKNLRIDHPGVTVAKLKELLASNEAELRTEAIRALAMHASPDAQVELRTLAADDKLDAKLRADALAGLTRSSGTSPETKTLLLGILKDGAPELQREAVRALRNAATQADVLTAVRDFAAKVPALKADAQREMAEQIAFTLKAGGVKVDEIPKELTALIGTRPANEAEWAASISKTDPPGDPAAGARIFYHPKGAQCFTCHRINGRGGNIGPDLTTIGATTVRERILNSILDPSRDVAPEFVPWQFVLKDGRRLSGVIVEENDGAVRLGDTTGTVTKIKVTDIDRRVVQKGSIMPDKLVDLLTQQELRDLVAFLINSAAADGK